MAKTITYREFVVHLSTEDADGSTPQGIAAMLRKVADKLNNQDKLPSQYQNILDANGNRVGYYGIRFVDYPA